MKKTILIIFTIFSIKSSLIAQVSAGFSTLGGITVQLKSNPMYKNGLVLRSSGSAINKQLSVAPQLLYIRRFAQHDTYNMYVLGGFFQVASYKEKKVSLGLNGLVLPGIGLEKRLFKNNSHLIGAFEIGEIIIFNSKENKALRSYYQFDLTYYFKTQKSTK